VTDCQPQDYDKYTTSPKPYVDGRGHSDHHTHKAQSNIQSLTFNAKSNINI